MSNDLRNSGHVMFLTIQWALQDREAMLDAVSVKKEKEAVRTEIRAIKRLRKKLFGDRETEEEHFFRAAIPVEFSELMKVARTLDQ
jgi:hypothetical protein